MSADAPRRLGRGLEALISTAKQQREPAAASAEQPTRESSDLRRVRIADIAPNLVALYASRAQGAFFTGKPARLQERIEQIEKGQYDPEWDRILGMDEQQLKDVCAAIK